LEKDIEMDNTNVCSEGEIIMELIRVIYNGGLWNKRC
jgi:hypothetical protein